MSAGQGQSATHPATWAGRSPVHGPQVPRWRNALGRRLDTLRLAWLVLLAGDAVLAHGVALVLGPPLDTAWFLQVWAAAMVAWLARTELDARWR